MNTHLEAQSTRCTQSLGRRIQARSTPLRTHRWYVWLAQVVPRYMSRASLPHAFLPPQVQGRLVGRPCVPGPGWGRPWARPTCIWLNPCRSPKGVHVSNSNLPRRKGTIDTKGSATTPRFMACCEINHGTGTPREALYATADPLSPAEKRRSADAPRTSCTCQQPDGGGLNLSAVWASGRREERQHLLQVRGRRLRDARSGTESGGFISPRLKPRQTRSKTATSLQC